MKLVRLLFITCLMLSFGFPVWANDQTKSDKHPVITVKKPSHNFEEVIDGEKVIHEFIITNSGDAELKISKVDTT